MSTHIVEQAFFFGLLAGTAAGSAVMTVLWAVFDHFYRIPKPTLHRVPMTFVDPGVRAVSCGPVPPAMNIRAETHQRNGSTREQAQAPKV